MQTHFRIPHHLHLPQMSGERHETTTSCSGPHQGPPTMALALRMAHELKLLETQPPHGVCAWPRGDIVTDLAAEIQGPEGTVYEGGVFCLSVRIPERYPFEPPNVRFITPIHHVNIDAGGRICLDTLNMPPKGGWRPALNIAAVLVMVRQLLCEPNPDDGLVADITSEFQHNRVAFDAKARAMTAKHARDTQTASPRVLDNGANQPPEGMGGHKGFGIEDCPKEFPAASTDQAPDFTMSASAVNIQSLLKKRMRTEDEC